MRSTFLDAGQLTARLAIEAPVDTPDGQGGVTTVFTEIAAAWALIEPVAGLVEEEASGEVFKRTHRIWLRFRSDIAAGMRLRKAGRIFWIGGTEDPDDSRRYLLCHCRETAA